MPDKTTSNSSSWQFASVGMQLAVTLLIGIYAGYKLDQRKGTMPWFTLAGSALGIILGLYSFLRRYFEKK